MTGRLRRTGNKILFLDCHIGHPFFAHDKFWVRTDYDAAAPLGSSLEHTSVCTFTIDEEDRLVEEVRFEAEVPPSEAAADVMGPQTYDRGYAAWVATQKRLLRLTPGLAVSEDGREEPEMRPKRVCPICSNEPARSTYVGYVGKDCNDYACTCGWMGKGYELKEVIP